MSRLRGVNLLKVDPERISRKRPKDLTFITTHLAKKEIEIVWVETSRSCRSRDKETSHRRKFL